MVGCRVMLFVCWVLRHSAHWKPEINWIERRELQLNRVAILLRFVELTTTIWFTNTPANATDPYCMENEHRAFAHQNECCENYSIFVFASFPFYLLTFYIHKYKSNTVIRWFRWVKSNTWSEQCHTNWPTDGFRQMHGARYTNHFQIEVIFQLTVSLSNWVPSWNQ